MTSIPTCLVEKNAFFREGIKSLLDGTDFCVEEAYSDAAAMIEEQGSDPDMALVILGIDGPLHDVQEDICQAKKHFPKCHVVILATRAESGPIVSAFSAGADGYLLRDISPPALLGSLNMVMLGEKVCPTPMLSTLAKRVDGDVENLPAEWAGHRLSRREMQVLKYLAGGNTNKEIARYLDITEATVKVHIKTVLRKLSLSNRTQAAIWAVNRGIINHDVAVYQAKSA